MKKVWVQIDPEVQKVVPVEATGEMLQRAAKVDLGKDCDEEGICCNLYQAMLSAAPTVPHLEGEDEPVGEFSMFGIAWRDASFVANAPPGTKLYTRPQSIGEIEARAECESCGEKYPIDQVMNENMEGGAMCDKCAISSLQDRLKCISLSVMSDNAYHDLLSESRSEIEARALEEAAQWFDERYTPDHAAHNLRQLAAQKRAAAGEGK